MKQKTLSLLILLIFLAAYLSGRSQTSDNSVDVKPHWKVDEAHSVKIITTTSDFSNGKTQNYISNFEANFKVLAITDSGYQVEWTYTDSKLANNEPVLESQIIAKLINVKMIIRLSNTGRFKELINVNDVKAFADKSVDELIAGSSSNPTMNIQYKAAKQLITTKKGLEIALLKQIKFYNFSFGFTYKLDYVQTNDIKFPNPLGGQPFDAVEKVQLTKLDNKSSTCVIETNKTIDGNAVKAAVIEYVKKISKADAKTIDDEIGKANLEISESTMQQIEFSKGLVQKSFFKRTMNLGFQNRTSVLEIETLD
ncbi:hypothetical protein FRZ67_23115 [Panacibacter ginsenosidivorans]|uniref:Uncharacterized protein n=1 Tax=Panacibacter ginsenosidivorans TaxID=1813871 RepID=A0A5B8VG31_9BACT|nr:hypothetical protein [Panacibacter ginsenosidivorans]QEC70051.1 hypothetical protein FRZ67_23115 [Panacibacter ginsenosidivorans]